MKHLFFFVFDVRELHVCGVHRRRWLTCETLCVVSIVTAQVAGRPSWKNKCRVLSLNLFPSLRKWSRRRRRREQRWQKTLLLIPWQEITMTARVLRVVQWWGFLGIYLFSRVSNPKHVWYILLSTSTTRSHNNDDKRPMRNWDEIKFLSSRAQQIPESVRHLSIYVRVEGKMLTRWCCFF